MTDTERRPDRHVRTILSSAAAPANTTLLIMPMEDAAEERAWDEAAAIINARKH